MNPMASKLKTMRPRSARVRITRNELQVQILSPHMKRGDKEVVEPGNERCLQQQLGLRAALLAGDQHFGDGRGFRKGKLAVHLAHEVAPQRNDEKNAETAAGQTDEDGLDRMRIEVKDVERGKREDRAGHNAADAPPMPVMITFSSRLERRL